MYYWRRLSDEERKEVFAARRAARHPWHGPPRSQDVGASCYILSAACYEHAVIVGKDAPRMEAFAKELVGIATDGSIALGAWCLLPNHYHPLVHTDRLADLVGELGRLHGRTSFAWNGEDGTRGRKVWHAVSDRRMRSEAHFWASVNYVHHNAVKHGYAERWQDWPWSSAMSFLDAVGRERAREIWEQYPVKDYGSGWDD